MNILTLIARIASLTMSSIAIILVILDFIITEKLKTVIKKNNIDDIIKVVRKDNSIRYVVVFMDEEDNSWRFVNITKDHNHICKRHFKTKEETIEDLENDTNVKKWEYIN